MGQLLPVDILGVGMVTPVGFSARASAAAIRAGLSRVQGAPPRDKHFQPQVMGLVSEEHLPPLLPSSPPCRPRARSCPHAMGACCGSQPLALQEALADWKGAPPPLLLALPDVACTGQDPVDASFLPQLAIQSGMGLDLQLGRMFRNGRAGSLMVLRHALELINTGRAAVVCVGGVDTYLDLRLLAELDAEGRLVGEGSGDAFIPGEGAAFLLLARPGVAKSLSLTPMARLLGTGEGAEKGHLLDAFAASFMGAGLLLWARPLTTLAGWPLPPGFLLGVGLFLVPWAGFNAWVSVQPAVPLRAAWVHLAVDASWVLGSGALLVAYAPRMSGVGVALVAGQAVAVLGVFALKLAGAARPRLVRG